MIAISTIGNVVNQIDDIAFMDYKEVCSEIHLNELFTEESLRELDQFSHLEVLFFFHKIGKSERVFGGKQSLLGNFPKVGVFALRSNNRPSRIGQSIVRLEKIEGKVLFVKGLDAINGTPVVDIKPVVRELLPSPNEIIQPTWAREMMRYYA